jgi:hypothetical protein
MKTWLFTILGVAVLIVYSIWQLNGGEQPNPPKATKWLIFLLFALMAIMGVCMFTMED